MSSREQREDPVWVPGKSSPQGPRTSQRTNRPGRKSIPSPTPEELQTMSVTDKTKVARRIRNREGAQRSKDQKNLEQQIAQLQRENNRLKAELTNKTAEMDILKTEFEDYKAAKHQNVSPFSNSSYYLASPNDFGPALHPDDPMHPDNNGINNNHSNSNITNPSTPTIEPSLVVGEGLALPKLATTPSAPTPASGGEPDVNAVMQWKYPGYYDSNMQYHPYNSHLPHAVEMEEPPLVFTPFAAVTSPREGLLSPSGGGGAGGGSSGHMRGTEFSAWRPRHNNNNANTATTTATTNNNNNNNNSNDPTSVAWWASSSDQQQYYRETSNTAREMARMMSSPAAFTGHLFSE
jgi:uncharacterized small protein (DUF1192 family)